MAGETVKYHITVIGLDNMENAVAALGKAPDFGTIGALEAVLRNQFVDTQVRVHVDTGSLKLSGKTYTTYDGKEWEGTIAYGGESPGGVHDPVTYAIYELARKGTHDFFRGVYGEDFNEEYLKAMEVHFLRSSGA
jgi:hypothetical protein